MTSGTSPPSCAGSRLARFARPSSAQAVPETRSSASPSAGPSWTGCAWSRTHNLQKSQFDRYVPPPTSPPSTSGATPRSGTRPRSSHHVEALRKLGYRPTGASAQFCFADGTGGHPVGARPRPRAEGRPRGPRRTSAGRSSSCATARRPSSARQPPRPRRARGSDLHHDCRRAGRRHRALDRRRALLGLAGRRRRRRSPTSGVIDLEVPAAPGRGRSTSSWSALGLAGRAGDGGWRARRAGRQPLRHHHRRSRGGAGSTTGRTGRTCRKPAGISGSESTRGAPPPGSDRGKPVPRALPPARPRQGGPSRW